jgi:hypothetical protein
MVQRFVIIPQIITAEIKPKIPRRIGKSTAFKVSIIESNSEFILLLVDLIYYHLILIIINYLQKKILPFISGSF